MEPSNDDALMLRIITSGIRFAANMSHNSNDLPLACALRLAACFDLESDGHAERLLKAVSFAVDCARQGLIDDTGTPKEPQRESVRELFVQRFGSLPSESFGFLPPVATLTEATCVFNQYSGGKFHISESALNGLGERACLVPSKSHIEYRSRHRFAELVRQGDFGEILSMLERTVYYPASEQENSYALCITEHKIFYIYPGAIGLTLNGRVLKRTWYRRYFPGNYSDEWVFTLC